MIARSLLHVTALSCISLGCQGSLTEVLVVVDSDLAVPTELDHVEIEVTAPDGTRRASAGDLFVTSALPATTAVVRRGGPLSQFTATATGMHGGTIIVQRTATFALVEGEVRVLRLDLLRRCVNAPDCGVGQTCAENGCRSASVAADELPPYGGVVPRIDGSAPWPDAAMIDAGSADAGSADAGNACVGFPTTCGSAATSSGCTCDGCTCDANCGFECDVRCRDSTSCAITAPAGARLNAQCTRSTCSFDVQGASNVGITCTEGSVCEIDCRDTSSCSVDCSGNGHCLLRCMGGGSGCRFESCSGTVMNCPMQVQVCDYPCP